MIGEKVKISDVLWFQEGPGVRNTQYTSDGVKLLNVANLVDGKVDLSTSSRYIAEDEAYGKYKHFLVDEGDFIIASSGIKVEYFEKKMGFVDSTQLPLCMNTSTIRFKSIDKNVIDIRYFMYYLKSEQFKEQLSKQITGSAQLNFGPSHLNKMYVPIPDMEQQKYIVNILDLICKIEDDRKEQLSKLDELVKARFVELFGDLYSTDFPKCKMGEICGIKHGYAFSGEFFTEEDNNILLVTPGNFKVGGGFQEKKCKFFTGEYSKDYVLNSGDLIVTMTDLSKNMDTLGYSAIVPSTNRVYLHNQRIGLFVDLSEKINRVFLMYFMQTNEYRDSIIASATGSTVHHTSPSKILDCDVFVPPLELQEQFAAFVEQTDKSKLEVQKSLEKLELLKKALMQKYFGR